jgi:nitrite reductase/ring-hydroxylating ferredoxin subunit
MIEGKVYAAYKICTHEIGTLDEGEPNGYDLKCQWHYEVFDDRHGKFQMQHYRQ